MQQWQIDDARRLKELYIARSGGMSQLEFGEEFGIGSQAMVTGYLNASSPLNIKAAVGFAKGLRVKIERFSPTLAGQIKDAAEFTAASLSDGAQDLSELVELLALYNAASDIGRRQILLFSRGADGVSSGAASAITRFANGGY